MEQGFTLEAWLYRNTAIEMPLFTWVDPSESISITFHTHRRKQYRAQYLLGL